MLLYRTLTHWISFASVWKKKQAEETVIYSFLLDLHVFVWKKCFVCYSMYTIFQDVNTSSYFQIMYSISWEWMHFRLIELKLTDIIFLRSPPFRTFLGKMIYSLLVVPKSSAIKTTSTWMKVVSVVMRLAPISRVLYVVHLKLLCSHLKNMWTLYLIVILNMMMMMMIKWFSNEEKTIFLWNVLWMKERKKLNKCGSWACPPLYCITSFSSSEGGFHIFLVQIKLQLLHSLKSPAWYFSFNYA